jgi:hypothetical protein
MNPPTVSRERINKIAAQAASLEHTDNLVSLDLVRQCLAFIKQQDVAIAQAWAKVTEMDHLLLALRSELASSSQKPTSAAPPRTD